ncbi:DUF3572 domain-containing protein [Planktotalea arctica]|uniref:DUF3572 domain-containing protein n=1 Tax=Planktotalea arctica TaxID=1481893 RepID=UPI000A175A58|nr:DUF3572 domain-containing protein [Planktotalea arctica]
MSLSRDAAEVFSLNVLGWLVGQDEIVPVFLGATGASESDLHTEAGKPEFMLSMLDFLMMNDEWIIACCDELRVPYERIGQARQALPGGAEMSWT